MSNDDELISITSILSQDQLNIISTKAYTKASTIAKNQKEFELLYSKFYLENLEFECLQLVLNQ